MIIIRKEFLRYSFKMYILLQGIVNLGIAENKLCEDLMVEKVDLVSDHKPIKDSLSRQKIF